MYPEDKINPARLSPQGAANMVGGMGDMVSSMSAPAPPVENPAERALEEVGGKFRDAWMNLEEINGKFGGDAEKFRAMQKAAEDWFTSIASNLPDSSQQY